MSDNKEQSAFQAQQAAMHDAILSLGLDKGDHIDIAYRALPAMPTDKGPMWIFTKGLFEALTPDYIVYRNKEGAIETSLLVDILRVAKPSGLHSV